MIGISLLAVFFTACDKDTEDISFVTNYPVLTMAGDALTIINKGDAYTDPGVTSMIGEEVGEVTVTGSANASEGGIYKIDYTSTNADGFSAVATRYVIVMDLASISGNDFTGTYERTFYGSPKSGTFSDWSSTNQPGVYSVKDVGGVDGADYEYSVTVYNVKDNYFVMPIQANALGGTIFASSTIGGSIPDLIEMSASGVYIWSVKGSGYGTNPRTFEKR